MGGRRAPGHPTDLFYELTIVDHVGTDSRLFNEESFGPVVPITVFETDEEAIALANQSSLGLQAAVFTSSLSRAYRYIDQIRAGTIVVNDSTSFWETHPLFGGALADPERLGAHRRPVHAARHDRHPDRRARPVQHARGLVGPIRTTWEQRDRRSGRQRAPRWPTPPVPCRLLERPDGRSSAASTLDRPHGGRSGDHRRGFTGLWAAMFATAEPGRRVVVLEAERIGHGAPSRNGGFCDSSLTHGLHNGAPHWPDELDALVRIGNENHDELLAHPCGRRHRRRGRARW